MIMCYLGMPLYLEYMKTNDRFSFLQDVSTLLLTISECLVTLTRITDEINVVVWNGSLSVDMVIGEFNKVCGNCCPSINKYDLIDLIYQLYSHILFNYNSCSFSLDTYLHNSTTYIQKYIIWRFLLLNCTKPDQHIQHQ